MSYFYAFNIEYLINCAQIQDFFCASVKRLATLSQQHQGITILPRQVQIMSDHNNRLFLLDLKPFEQIIHFHLMLKIQ